MKLFYPLATLLLVSFIFTTGALAQTYTGGTYTAVRNGNWHTTSGPNAWDPNGEPPVTCLNCSIVINAVVHLNTSVTLSGGSLLNINGSGTQLLVDNSGGADWASSFNVILLNDNSNPVNTIKTTNGGIGNASAADNSFDGFFTAFSSSPTLYFKQIGNGASAYSGTTVINNRNASSNLLSPGSTLTANGTLPISLVDFAAVLSNGAVDLSWRTLLEANSDHFDIERSTNGGSKWDVIGKVAAKGNSSTPVSYSFTDANPGSGTIQYRVHGYDKDGRPTLSTIQTVRTTPIASVSVYPNPAKDYVNVSLPVSEATAGTVHIRLIGQSGQLLVEKSVTGAGGTVQTFAVSNYPPGNYLIQVTTADGAKQVSKVFLSRN
jgi:hypothetical protein